MLFGMWYVPQRRLVSDQQRELSNLREAGEPLHHRDLLPPAPPALDGTPFYRQMMEQLEQVQDKLPQEAWEELSQLVADPTKPVNLQLVRTVVKETRPALNALRKAMAFPHMRLVQFEHLRAKTKGKWMEGKATSCDTCRSNSQRFRSEFPR